jgi:hypothetical protein
VSACCTTCVRARASEKRAVPHNVNSAVYEITYKSGKPKYKTFPVDGTMAAGPYGAETCACHLHLNPVSVIWADLSGK